MLPDVPALLVITGGSGGAGAGAMTKVRVAGVVPPALLAETGMLKVPGWVGVPEICPVEEFNVSPGGNAGAA
jgi:hypothetical protein